MEKIICPICDSVKIKEFLEKNNCDLYECAGCGLVFVYPIPKNLDEIYDKEYFFKQKENGGNAFGYTDYEKDKEPMKDIFINYLEQLEKLARGRNIFDVGAATGYFLDLARARGWNTAGVELSPYAAEIGQNKGHEIFQSRLLDLNIEDKFDIVTMWDVLEHLDEPEKYLSMVNAILKKGGLLVINTIDKKSWWARFWGKKWHAIVPPEHLFYYSRKNLDILLKKSGFEISRIKKVGKKFSLAYIFKILNNWQKIGIWNKLSDYFNRDFWRKFSIPINLRDNIFIIARKIETI